MQYTAFHALSIVYIWIIQQKTRRSALVQSKHDPDKLFSCAEKIHGHLAEATQLNAPNLRYSIILDELRQDTQRILQPQRASGGQVSSTRLQPEAAQAAAVNLDFDDSFGEWAAALDYSANQDLWLQLDTFPLEGISHSLDASWQSC